MSAAREHSAPEETVPTSPRPAVSVVMAVCNGEPFLGDALQSILGQTVDDFEFVIINDGSSDGSAARLAEYQARDDRIRVHHQRNRGLTAALNRGCMLAQGRYIARMDADDVAFSDRLARQIEFLDRNPRVGLVAGGVVRVTAQKQPVKRLYCPTTHAEIVAALMNANCITHPTVMMRAGAFREVGGYRPAFLRAQDYDLWLRLAECWELASLPDPVLYYRIHPQQLSTQHRVQQTLSALGAQASARIRRETGFDPLGEREVMTRDALYQYGVSREQIDDALVKAYCRDARVLEEMGCESEAIRLLQRADSSVRSNAALKRALAAIYWRRAARMCSDRRFELAAAALAGAVAATPLSALGRLARAARAHTV